MPPRLLSRLSALLPLLIVLGVTWAHVLFAPYTKVEESFTLHAVHDFLAYGLRPKAIRHWDHTTFPGAVPRSFLPSALLGLASYPFCALGVWTGWITTKVHVQMTIRLTLATLFSLSFAHLLSTLRLRFGPSVRTFYLFLAVTQFHVMFYAGRTLPNFMALPGVVYAFSLLLCSSSPTLPPPAAARLVRRALVVLTAIATVIRLELALIVLPTALLFVLRRKLTLLGALFAGLISGLGSLALSAPLDLYLWLPALSPPSSPLPALHTLLSPSFWHTAPRPTFPFPPLTFIWPELASMHYNVVLGQSAAWGESPWHAYLTAALPKIALLALPLDALGHAWALAEMGGAVRLDTRGLGRGVGEVWKTLGPGCMVLVVGLSTVGHKEWRFIIYALFPILLSASLTLDALWHLRPPRLRRLARLLAPSVFVAQLGIALFSAHVSALNYPGGGVGAELSRVGTAWGGGVEDKDVENLAGLGSGGRRLVVHYSAYPLQNGASLFTFGSSDGVDNGEQAKRRDWFTLPPAFPAERAALGSSWEYSKSEAVVLHPSTFRRPSADVRKLADRITHLVLSSGEAGVFVEDGCWAQVGGVEGYDGLELPFRSAEHRWGRIRTAEKVVVLERKDEARCRA